MAAAAAAALTADAPRPATAAAEDGISRPPIGLKKLVKSLWPPSFFSYHDANFT